MAEFPVVNGRHYSWASAEINIDGQVYTGITSINYKEELKPSLVEGTGVYPQGDTRGVYTCSADMEMTLHAANALRAALSAKQENGSVGLVRFAVLVYFAEGPDDPTHEVKIVNCRWQGADNSNAKGSADASLEKVTLHPWWLEKDGTRLLAPADAGGR